MLLACFQYESRISIKVKALDDWQLFVTIAEIEGDAVCLRTVGLLQQIAVRLHFLKGQHNDVIWIEMGIRHLQNVVDMQGVAPNGILADVRFCIGLVNLVRKSYHLALLREPKVVVGIL